MRNTLKPLRAARNLTQKELASKACCSRAYIIGLEGGNPPSIQTAYRIARIFKKPVEEIFIPDWVKLPTDKAQAGIPQPLVGSTATLQPAPPK